MLERSYGNALVLFAPQPLIDQWLRADWERRIATNDIPTRAAAAQRILRWAYEFDEPVMFADQSKRLIELYGVEYFADLARQSPWLYTAVNLGRDVVPRIAGQLTIPTVFLTQVEIAVPYPIRSRVTHPTARDSNGHPYSIQMAHRGDDGSSYGESYGGYLWLLTPEQIALLTLEVSR